ncbi:MAG: hypothetical protein ACKOW9_05810, partial [Candidatus Paceibacterota bacterium]
LIPSKKINTPLGALLIVIVCILIVRNITSRMHFAPVLRSMFLIAIIVALIYINEKIVPAHLLSDLFERIFFA